jgi:hypothetical protein
MVIVLIVVGTGFGILWLHLLWINEVKKQHRLDSCVEKITLQVRRGLENLDQANREMRALKVTASASHILAPEAKALLLAAVHMEYLRQEYYLVQHRLLQAQWMSGLACKGAGDRFWPLSGLQLKRLPSDINGEGLLVSTTQDSQNITIGVLNGKRRAFAKVKGKFNQSKYESYWFKGPSFY